MSHTAHPEPIGRVWMNGDPWLVADRADAEAWTGFHGDYDQIIELPVTETRVTVGAGRGLVLQSDYDDSTVEVFRVAPSELLIVGVRYADPMDYSVFLNAAFEADLEPDGDLRVGSGEVAIFGSALPWSEGTVVNSTPFESANRGAEFDGQILVTSLAPGTYDFLTAHIDRDRFGLAIWRLRRR